MRARVLIRNLDEREIMKLMMIILLVATSANAFAASIEVTASAEAARSDWMFGSDHPRRELRQMKRSAKAEAIQSAMAEVVAACTNQKGTPIGEPHVSVSCESDIDLIISIECLAVAKMGCEI